MAGGSACPQSMELGTTWAPLNRRPARRSLRLADPSGILRRALCGRARCYQHQSLLFIVFFQHGAIPGAHEGSVTLILYRILLHLSLHAWVFWPRSALT